MTLFGPDSVSHLLNPEQWLQIGEGEAFLSHGAPLMDSRYISSHLGEIAFRILDSPSDSIAFRMQVYINTPIPPPAGCSTCAKVTSMIPEISVETGRVN